MRNEPSEDQKMEMVLGAVKEGIIPRILYKYRRFDEWTDSTFQNNQLFFPSPKTFNDPFDCNIHDDNSQSLHELLAYFVEQNYSPVETSVVILQNAQSDGQLVKKTLKNTRDKLINNLGVLCLSKRADSILMWSHYAFGHTGYVMAFDVEKDPLLFWTPHVVKYTNKYPSYCYIKEQSGFVSTVIGTKAGAWCYEKEVRIIKWKIGYQKFHCECLTEVVLGSAIEESDLRRICHLLSDPRYRHVKISTASTSLTSFALDFNSTALPA